MSTLELKGSIYDLISTINDESILRQVHEMVRDVLERNTNLADENPDIFKPIRETVTLEELKKEQNFKGIDRPEFDALAKQLDIQESYEELIA